MGRVEELRAEVYAVELEFECIMTNPLSPVRVRTRTQARPGCGLAVDWVGGHRTKLRKSISDKLLPCTLLSNLSDC